MSLHPTGKRNNICQILNSLSLQISYSLESPGRSNERVEGEGAPGATLSGSLTVEAALVLSIFLFFWSALFSMFPAMQIHFQLRMAMEQTAEETAMLAYAFANPKQNPQQSPENHFRQNLQQNVSMGSEWRSALETLGQGGSAALYYYGRILSLVGSSRLNEAGIAGGCGGLSLAGSELPGEQPVVKIVLFYQQEIPFLPMIKIPISQQVCRRAWTGAELSEVEAGEAEDSTPVYITENGQVFHLSENCSHLLLSVQRVTAEEVGNYRNTDGGKYYPCERCMRGAAYGEVYITEDGDRYHSDRGCAGLKRSVTQTTRGETDLPPCSRCGQGGG